MGGSNGVTWAGPGPRREPDVVFAISVVVPLSKALAAVQALGLDDAGVRVDFSRGVASLPVPPAAAAAPDDLPPVDRSPGWRPQPGFALSENLRSIVPHPNPGEMAVLVTGMVIRGMSAEDVALAMAQRGLVLPGDTSPPSASRVRGFLVAQASSPGNPGRPAADPDEGGTFRRPPNRPRKVWPPDDVAAAAPTGPAGEPVPGRTGAQS